MGNHPSAGVYTYESDSSVRATGIATSIGAIVGASNRGPVGVRVFCADNTEFTAKFGNSTPQISFMHLSALTYLKESNQLYVTRVANGAEHAGVVIETDKNLAVPRPIDRGYVLLEDFQFETHDLLYISSANPGLWGNSVRILARPDVNVEDGKTFIIDVFEGTSTVPVESWKGTLYPETDGYGAQTFIEEVINQNSTRIFVVVNEEHPLFENNDQPIGINTIISADLKHGSNGDAINSSHIMEGWNLYDDTETVQVNILINGGYTDVAVQRKMEEIARTRDDAFAILDVPSDKQGVQEAINFRRNELNLNTSYAALYSSDILVSDEDNGIQLFMPPSGHVAAAFARTDRIAATWFAPAGVRRGKLDAIGVRETYKQGHRNLFAPNQINPIRNMPGRGINIWGQDTLQSYASALSNVNVRRLLIFLKNSIANAANASVFEPNDEQLRAELRSISTRFLTPILNGRGLYSFVVVCDERNNTKDMIAAGDVALDIYIDPVIPAKRILIRAVVPRTGGITFAVDLVNA
jgi:phage tail sheath protein FI